MAEPLKNIYSESFFEGFTIAFKQLVPSFDSAKFTKAIFSEDWSEMELKARMYHISRVLHDFLPQDFPSAARILSQLSQRLKGRDSEMSFEYMFLPDFIEKYGIDDFETSVEAMEEITQFTSCEFAVRPFFLKYPEKMLGKMKGWAQHTDHRVRRLASEGCRPRLPWAMALPAFKKDPTPILPILEALKSDSSDFVRRSVANNLNDVSKDHPSLVLQIANDWKGQSKETDWIVKHACRGLLKQGIPEAMLLFGFADPASIKLSDLKITTPVVKIGDNLGFQFQLENTIDAPVNVRLEFGIYFQKANGSLSRKVFKISEKVYSSLAKEEITKEHSFRLITTRTYHLGLHQLSIIVNGKEMQKLDFQLSE